MFFALLQPGDKFLGMDLACGGHLTHGSPVNISGKWFQPVAYGVRPDDHLIDFDQVEALAADRDALWKRVGDADFLTTEEKRAAVGYGK